MRTLIFLLQSLIGFPVGSAFVQANPGAPTPNSSGTGVVQPGITSTRTGVDEPTTGSVVGR
jgi:hypothetical protein